ncbi:MAG: bifunctional diaminohydroxyphosphoribosylaminopyrimidine deaminase/5-amino-6-(5-phosphoribosylamino)uracil reductase RibD [Pseudoflavonifractor sp.]|nr:bifunctional diaminohydroxyphosphoribosylaminopyrimidine deaminase/5-amino-6-(5-phosphoribosylamino)uracil reductase RibD [Pseudoflavonifractor sp.]
MTEEDIRYMRRALELARHGELDTSPNPMVGAVIVHDGKIIGEGYHRRCGSGHAEVNAIASVEQPELLTKATMYVTLEPCSHYGKTPPCAKLIIDKRIPRVVVGMQDPNDKVAGRGITMLRDAGIEVEVGVLEEECRQLNRKFVTAHTLGRPFITLKWAQSADGYIDRDRADNEPASRISTPLTAMLAHRLRATHDCIIVGANTMRRDNPSLTTRHWAGRSPFPVIFTRSFDLPTKTNLTQTPLCMPGIGDGEPWSLERCLTRLRRYRDTTSVLVEGGANLLQQFIDQGLWDEIHVETSPDMLGQGIKAPSLAAIPTECRTVDGHLIAVYRR